jgi:hypothetical protein
VCRFHARFSFVFTGSIVRRLLCLSPWKQLALCRRSTESSNLALIHSPQCPDQTPKRQTGRHQQSWSRFLSSLQEQPQTSIRDAGVAANALTSPTHRPNLDTSWCNMPIGKYKYKIAHTMRRFSSAYPLPSIGVATFSIRLGRVLNSAQPRPVLRSKFMDYTSQSKFLEQYQIKKQFRWYNLLSKGCHTFHVHSTEFWTCITCLFLTVFQNIPFL